MIILWVRKAKKDKEKEYKKDESKSFHDHDEVMKKFRQEHPEIGVISDKHIMTGDGNMLAPVQKVKLTQYIQN